MPEPAINSRKSVAALVFSRPIRLLGADPSLESSVVFHAPVPIFPADPARNAEGGGDRLAPLDAARRHDAAGGRRHLRLPAAWLSRAADCLLYTSDAADE